MNETEIIKAKVYQIILANIPNLKEEELTDNIELFSVGLNSLNAVSLVLGLEETFGFQFDMDEISYDSFRAITDIVELIKTKVNS